MKRNYLSFLLIGVLTFATQFNLIAQNIIWEEHDQLPRALFGAIAVNYDTCVYLIGGQTGNMTGRLNTIYEYNFHDSTWIERDTMQTEKLGFVAAQANNKIYAIRKNINEEYDPKTNRWTTRTPIPEDNVHLTGGSINNKIYVINANNWVYDPIKDTWEKFASMISQTEGTSVVADNKLYIIGGLSNSNTSDHVEMYDPITNKWEQKANLPVPLFASTAVCIKDKIIVIGGETVPWPDTEMKITDNVFMYDIKKDKWTQLNNFVCPTNWSAATVYNDFIYVFGGANDKYEPYPTVWRGKLNYDTNANKAK